MKIDFSVEEYFEVLELIKKQNPTYQGLNIFLCFYKENKFEC